MVVIIVEVWPGGDKSKRFHKGTITLVDSQDADESTDSAPHEYVGVFCNHDMKPVGNRSRFNPLGGFTKVSHSPSRGPWHLLKRFLNEVL